MIRQLRGELWSTAPGEVVLGVGGVGYRVYVPTSLQAALPATGGQVTLHIHTHVREDTLALFGFTEPAQLALFEAVIEVGGVGPRLGLGILSGLSPNMFIQAIRGGDLAALTRVSGVGKKTAERLILELKDRLKDHPAAVPSPTQPTYASDAEAALLALGYSEAEARAALSKLGETAGADSAQLVRRALGVLSHGASGAESMKRTVGR